MRSRFYLASYLVVITNTFFNKVSALRANLKKKNNITTGAIANQIHRLWGLFLGGHLEILPATALIQKMKGNSFGMRGRRKWE